jgi:hypothetical protein
LEIFWMTTDTEPNKPRALSEAVQRRELAAPPRLLFWLVIGLFILAIVGSITGILVFRSVLQPGQQQRVIGVLPFMTVFLNRPPADATLPTVEPGANTSGITADQLLDLPLAGDETQEAAAEPGAEATALPVSLLPTATSTATDTPTPLPTALPTAIPTMEAVISVANLTGVQVANAEAAPAQDEAMSVQPVPQSVALDIPSDARLFGFTPIEQTWNNCGPANITMALSYYSWQEDQTYAAGFLKPDREDKNVSPTEMVAFVNDETGVKAITRIGGSVDLLKEFLAAGFPVLIETGYAPEGYDWIGHYRTVVGYDDSQGAFYVYDSYLGTGAAGEGLTVPYDEFDHDWQAFNRVFIVVYLADRESEVATILGDLADPMGAAEHAFEVAQAEARENPQSQFAWFNMGTSLTRMGDYERAAAAYDRANQIGLHFRMLWYQFGPFEAYFNVGRYDDVLAYVNVNLSNGGEYVEETYYWQGRVYEQQGRTAQAADAFRIALMHNPNYIAAQEALDALNA